METDLVLYNVLADIETISAKTIPDVAVILSPDIDGMAWLLARIRQAIRQLKDAEMMVEDEMVKVMPGKTKEVSGLGVIEMHTGAVRKGWKKEELMEALIHVIAHDMPNLGNIDTGEHVNLIDLVSKLVAMFTDAATPSWKVTGLRKLGIDPDDYCETTWGRKTIQTPTLTTPLEETDD